jgi:undecaprenyl-diphosphatase
MILPQLLGLTDVVAAQSATESYFLALLVGLHVATALALVVFYRDTWARIIRGVITSIETRRIETPDQRLGWLLIVGLLLEHPLRVVFAKPLAAAGFLVINGLILLCGEWVRRRAQGRVAGPARDATQVRHATPAGRRHDDLGFRVAGTVGVAQAFALLPGISRSGITMVAGLVRGLDHEDSARFSFLLATPIILAAGVYKLPDLLGPNGDGVRPQILVGSVAAGLAAYLSVRFLTRYFSARTLTPFAIYCLAVGLLALVRFA